MHIQLYLLHIGRHKLGQLLVLSHFEVADEFVELHLILDGFLRAGYGGRVHDEFKGDLNVVVGTLKEPS